MFAETDENMNRNGFTIPEVMTASVISMLVLAVVTAVIIETFKDWRAGSVNAEMSIYGRLVRERLLYGIKEQSGLYHASRSSIAYTNSSLAFKDCDYSNSYTIVMYTNTPLRVVDVYGSNVFVGRSDMLIDSARVFQSNNLLSLELSFYIKDGTRKYVQPQKVKVYLLNE